MQRQREARGEEEIEAQNYLGIGEVIDSSVIPLNGIAASHAANTLLLQAVGLYRLDQLDQQLIFPLEDEIRWVAPRKDPECSFCSLGDTSRYALGDPIQSTALSPAVNEAYGVTVNHFREGDGSTSWTQDQRLAT